MAPVRTLWFEAPTGGEAPSLPPDQLRPDQARQLRNYLVHHPGRIVPRGGLGGPDYAYPNGQATHASGGAMHGHAVFNDSIFISYRAPSAGPRVDYWRVPINRPTTAGDLSPFADQVNILNTKTGVLDSYSDANPEDLIGASSVQANGALYAVSVSGSDITADGIKVPQTAIIKRLVDNTTVTLLTGGPRCVQAVFAHNDRIWAAAARTPGGSDYDPSQIFYTNPGGTTALTDSAADWQNPVTGESNRFGIGAGNDGDFVVGFGRAAGHLVVFKRRSVWILYGTSPDTYTLRQLRVQSGCVDFRSIAVCDEGVYFASQLGYELFDGERFRILSEPVSDTWMPLSIDGSGGGDVTHAYIRASPLPNGYLHLSIGVDSHVAAAADGTTASWLFYRPTGAWVDLRTAMTSQMNLSAAGFINRFAMTKSAVTAWGQGYWARADAVPYGVLASDGLMDVWSGGFHSVNLEWLSGLRNLVDRWTGAQLHGVTADYHQRNLSDSASPPSWATLSSVDGYGDAVMPSEGLTAFRNTVYPTRARPMLDRKHAVPRGDLSMRLSSTSGSTSTTRISVLNVHGMGVAFVPARERHVT